MNTDNNKTNLNQSYLTFCFDDEQFALPVSQVDNIMEITPITHVPKSPPYMKGLINLRGNVLPVIDAKQRFGLSPISFSEDTIIIVVTIVENGEPIQVGALVDRVEEVIRADNTQLAPPPSSGTKFNADYIKAIIQTEDDFIYLLKINKLLATIHFEAEQKKKKEKKLD